MSDGASSISVCVRVRPFTIKEAAQISHSTDGPIFLGDGSLAGVPQPKLTQKGLRSVIKVVDDRCLVFDPPEDNPVQRFSRSVVPQGKRVKDQTFGFDRVFDENSAQADIYEGTTRSLLDSFMDGYNATVFAYGATGCGKTHTITGTLQQPGIIFLTMQELFERISEVSNEKVSEISLSYLEIYNETIRDLLDPTSTAGKNGLTLREDAKQTVSVTGLSSHAPKNVQEVMDMIVQGNECRTMSPTDANATSSRSHAVLQINLAQRDRNADINEPHTMATLSIIDLAGSERASATKNRGERLIEGANINKSLLALGSCINALCDPRKKNHVPYRNSKLTRLLKFSLGGNCKTVMIVCVSPSSAHFDETQNTLRYANRAKNIQTKVTRNVFNVNRHVKDFLVKIDEQRALIDELKQQLKEHENVAFVKFRKQTEKKDLVAKEGVARIRSAYEHSATERNEKVNSMKRLRQIEKRITMITAWISALDNVCDAQEDDCLLQNLSAMRKTASGIVLELESSRHHYHQKISKSNWERAIDSALQNSLRQLKEIDNTSDGLDTANLHREVELLKANAEREALVAVAEQDKCHEGNTVEVLVRAHFETISAVQSLMGMDEEEAVQCAKGILSRILQKCTETACHIVQPNGNVTPIESFPPTKKGTPKRKKTVNIMNGTPLKSIRPPVLQEQIPPAAASPMRLTPKRRKMFGAAAKKGVSFTPKKKSPAKIKRAVRWRDDTEDGTLAEYAKTPQKLDVTPDNLVTSFEPAPSVNATQGPPQSSFLPSSLDGSTEQTDSSPILPPPPESSSLDTFSSDATSTTNTTKSSSKSDRFRSGFLSKKAVVSNNNTTSTGSPLPPTVTRLSSDSEDTDHSSSSPLRDLEPGKILNRPPHSLHLPSSSPLTSDDAQPPKPTPLPTHTFAGAGNNENSSTNIGSDTENHPALNPNPSLNSSTSVGAGASTKPPSTTLSNTRKSSGPTYRPSKAEVAKVRSELHKRASMSAGAHLHAGLTGTSNGGSTHASAPALRTAQRRRSPTASRSTSSSVSPPASTRQSLAAGNGSPPGRNFSGNGSEIGNGNGMFTASQARRMGDSAGVGGGMGAGRYSSGVLSPRGGAVVKGGVGVSVGLSGGGGMMGMGMGSGNVGGVRRTTMAGAGAGGMGMGGGMGGGIGVAAGNEGMGRTSLGGRGIWR